MGHAGRPAIYTLEQKAERKREANRSCRQRGLEKNSEGLCAVVRCESHLADQSSRFCAVHSQRYRYKNSKWTALRGNAKKRGITFSLEGFVFKGWLGKQARLCEYCGIDERLLVNAKDKKHRHLTIDRKDNDRGYELNNLCLACVRCNNLKNNFFTHDEWETVAENYMPRVFEFHNLQEITC